jgi:hypothetical protein
VVLLDLVPADHNQSDPFEADTDRRQKLSSLIDRINDRYCRCSMFRAVSVGRPRVQGPCRLSPGAGEVGVLARQPTAPRASLPFDDAKDYATEGTSFCVQAGRSWLDNVALAIFHPFWAQPANGPEAASSKTAPYFHRSLDEHRNTWIKSTTRS